MRSWMPEGTPAAGETPALPRAADVPLTVRPEGLNKLEGLNDGPKRGCGNLSSPLAICEKYSRHSGETDEASRKNFSYNSSTNARFAGLTVDSIEVIKSGFWFHLQSGDNLPGAVGVERERHGFADEVGV